MSYPVLIMIVPLAWFAVDKLISWVYARHDRQTIEWPS